MQTIEIMRKPSIYRRELTRKQIESLKAKYAGYKVRRFDGFLNRDQRERLLGMRKTEVDASSQQKYDFYYSIRDRAKTALEDFQLLCDVLSEDQLKAIFAERDTTDQKARLREDLPKVMRYIAGDYPLTEFLAAVIPTQIRHPSHRVDERESTRQEWRKDVLEEITIKCLMWYLRSGLCTGLFQRRMLADTMEMIVAITGSGRVIARDSYDMSSGDDIF